ncbi:MAG: hypothetical protein J5636_01465 [Clostridiales bacterium]|nr:hypothetical protein [Clostridiales bacterium]
MKKLVAVLLTAAMILGCAGCTSEETTKKKKKTKKTTEKTEETDAPTEDPTDDTTDEPTDTTDEPTDTTSDTVPVVDTSDSTSDTSKAPSAPSELIISNDLISLGALTNGYCLTYGALDPTGELVLPGNLPVSLYFYWESLTTSNGGTVLNDELEALYEQIRDSSEEHYEQYLKEFTDAIDRGESPMTYSLYEENQVYRADSQIFSFRLHALTNGDYESNDSSFYVNVDPDTLNDITIDDVITDLDAFEDYLESYLNEIGETYHLNDYIDMLDDGEDCFGLVYDGLMFDNIKVPVVGHEELFNMSYFGSTPENYSLFLDEKGELVWDFDGDGKLDELKCDFDYSAGELYITVNGQKYTITNAEAPNINYMEDIAFNSPCVVMFTEGRCYLVVSLNESDAIVGLYFFDMTDGTPKYVMDRYGILENVLDPNYFSIAEDVDLLGGMNMDRYYQLKGDGTLIPQTAFVYGFSHPLLTYTSITGDEFNWDNGNMIGSYTIPAGSVVQIIAYGPNNGALVLKVLSRDTSDVHYVNLETDKENMIAGVSVGDIFESQLYIGG